MLTPPRHDPSPLEIERECIKIRAGWSKKTELKRRHQITDIKMPPKVSAIRIYPDYLFEEE